MKVTFSQLGEHGRLGNQLWQYAFLRTFKELRTDVDVFIPKLNTKTWHGQQCLLNCFNIQLPQTSEKLQSYNVFFEKDPQIYNPDVWHIQGDTDFIGFFQNTNYFKGYEELIRREFALKLSLNSIFKKQMDRLRDTAKRELVSIHIRRGDLVEQTKNDNYFTENGIYFQYLNKALEHFPKDKYAFLIFTGGSRENEYQSDINWCKQNLPFNWEEDFVQIYSTGNPIIDFGSISACDHNIMSHASSFSWWAAYLNCNMDKKVIAPKYYFIDRRDRFISGFYPEEFTLI